MKSLTVIIAVIIFITFLILTLYLSYTAFFKNVVSVSLFKKDILLFIAFVIAGAIHNKVKV